MKDHRNKLENPISKPYNRNYKFTIISIITIMISLFSCTSKKKLETVKDLDIEKYSGLWFEIAKLPNRFEKNLKCVSATYTINKDGSIKVFNQGYNTKSLKTEKITGKATIPNSEKPGEIKVSFFGPFKGDYFVMDIDTNYQTVLVGSPSRKYLWILSRSISIDEGRMQELIAIAKANEFDTSIIELNTQDCD
jgi:apolipoprotein D and lipocalin family protein